MDNISTRTVSSLADVSHSPSAPLERATGHVASRPLPVASATAPTSRVHPRASRPRAVDDRVPRASLQERAAAGCGPASRVARTRSDPASNGRRFPLARTERRLRHGERGDGETQLVGRPSGARRSRTRTRLRPSIADGRCQAGPDLPGRPGVVRSGRDAHVSQPVLPSPLAVRVHGPCCFPSRSPQIADSPALAFPTSDRTL